MTNQELKAMVVLEMKRAIECAFLGLDERLDELEVTKKEREKAFEYIAKMEKAFEKKVLQIKSKFKAVF